MRGHGNRNAEREKVKIMTAIGLFGACTRDELAQLARLFDGVTRPAGSIMTREGAQGKEFYVIVDGIATASAGGREIAALQPGDFFGEMSLLDQAPRSATVVAKTDLELLVTDARSFFALVETAPSVGMRMMRTMSERLRSIESIPATIS
jgi:CRP-like cAMP-binding protein